jgi:hypothetical protein
VLNDAGRIAPVARLGDPSRVALRARLSSKNVSFCSNALSVVFAHEWFSCDVFELKDARLRVLRRIKDLIEAVSGNKSARR